MISFIIPLNHRKLDRLNGLYRNISVYYGQPCKENYEIIIIEQNQNEPFKLGQNRNIGFKESVGDVVVFLDVDIRFKNKIDFINVLKNSKNRSVICWEFITQVTENSDYVLTELGAKKKGVGKGGCVVFNREDYIKSCGHSNLVLGWGKEDEILLYRSNMTRLNGVEIYHVFHKDKRDMWGLSIGSLGKALDRNVKLVNMVRDGAIDKKYDSFNETLSDIVLYSKKYEGFVRHYTVSNIRVPDNFRYMNLYDEMKKL